MTDSEFARLSKLTFNALRQHPADLRLWRDEFARRNDREAQEIELAFLALNPRRQRAIVEGGARIIARSQSVSLRYAPGRSKRV